MIEKINEDVIRLFDEAKQRSEFDFILTLINYRGMGSRRTVTNLYEWFDAMEFYKGLFESSAGKEKTRIGAHLYSTFFENSDFYNVLGSLCRIKLGYKGSSYLFWKTRKNERYLGVGEKQSFLIELLVPFQLIIANNLDNSYLGLSKLISHGTTNQDSASKA
ncbi:MAG: hypothetical protein WDN75_08860 [Bacteroidota bacterium]